MGDMPEWLEQPDSLSAAYDLGWAQGVADAGAKLIGVVAAYRGHDQALMDTMVERLGSLTPPGVHDG